MPATTYHSYRRADQSLISAVRWKRAMQVGLAVGGIMFLLTRGIPWVGSGAINPAIMGREVAPEEAITPLFSFSVVGLHLMVSMLYAIIIAPIVHGFRPWMASAVGAVAGLILYFINYALSGLMMEGAVTQREWQAIAIHVIFGIVVAGAYKGFVRNQQPKPASQI